jgi:hypothetical protein
MFRKPFLVTGFVTGCLILFHVLTNADSFPWLSNLIFLLSPFLMAGLAYSILKHGKYNGRDLHKDEEWGYCDKDKSKLDTF